MDEALELIHTRGPSLMIQAYADDVCLLQAGKVWSIISDRIRDGLMILKRWCETKGLKLNPGKTDILPLTCGKTIGTGWALISVT